MKGKRFLAGLLTAAMLITSPAVTKASLVDDDLVELNEIEQTEEPEPEEPAINPAEESMEESVEDDSGGGGEYETDWDELKREISNAISAFSLDEEEEPLESESTTKAEIFDDENGGDDLTSIFSKIGNYKLNWVGNENYYWKGNAGAGAIGIDNYENSLKTAYTKCDKNISKSKANIKRKAAAARVLGLSSSKKDDEAAKKIYNSSSCKIAASSDTDRIYKAYLVWNTRVGHVGGYHYEGYTGKYTNSPNTVALVRPDGTAMKVKAKKTYKDSRQGDRQFGHLNATGTGTDLDTGAINCYYTYYTDVTSFVKGDTKAGGYGNYTVCNIKPWDSDGHGGGCSCTWQLIFVEHRFDKVVTYTDINLGSYFAMPEADKAMYEVNFVVPHTMKIPKGAEMQMMFGSGRGSAGTKGSATISKGSKTETVNTKYKTSTGKVTTAPPKSGIYCGDKSVDNLLNEYGDTLYVLTGAKRNADNAWSGDTITGKFVSLDGNWKSYSLFGMSIQLGTDFVSDHDITIDQSNMSDATVKSTITNKSTDKYGIYDGTVTVELDDKLTVNKKADGSWDISTKGHGSLSSVKGNTVTFTGVRLVSKGDTFKYTIKCTTSTYGIYYTSDELKGKLYNGSDKKNPETNVKIDPACCGDDNDSIPPVNPANIRYHLNATTEAHAKTVAGFEYDKTTGMPYDKTPKNTPESMDYPYAIKSYDAVGFHANSGYKPGMTVGVSGMVWTDSSGKVYYPSNVIYPTDDMDLYAHWIPDNSSPGGSPGGSNCYHFISYSGDTWDENNIIRHEFVTEPYKKLLPVPDKVKPGEKQTYHNEWFYYARSVPTPAVLNGWVFDGWIPASEVKESGGLYQDSSSYKLTSSTLSQEYAKNPTDTVFYAQYHRDLNTYFVQQKEIKKITKIVYRGSKDINKYEWKKLITSPRQILKNGWTACGWTTDADCMAAAECADGGTLYTDRFKNVYYGLYQRDVTISYDSNGYDPVKSMPNPDVKKAYYSTSGWDKSQEKTYSNAARQWVSANQYLDDWFATTLDAIDKRKATDRGYQFPSMTIADLIPVYRKINSRETDVVPVYWCTNPSGSEEDTVDSEGWLDPYSIRVNCYPQATYEFREDTVLYQQYKTVTLEEGEKIHKSVSILAGDTIGIGSDYVTDKLSDTGRVYVSEDHGIATVTQKGVVTGVSDGVTTVKVYASDGKTEIGDCTVTVSTAAVSIPSVLRPGQYAEVGIEVRSAGKASVTGTLSMSALSALSGRNTGAVYKLDAYTRRGNGDYSLLGEGSQVVTATANKWNSGKASQAVDFKVEPTVSLEMLTPDSYDATVVWKLDLKLN